MAPVFSKGHHLMFKRLNENYIKGTAGKKMYLKPQLKLLYELREIFLFYKDLELKIINTLNTVFDYNRI